MKIGIKTVARTIALVLALCATGGAWAAKPKAVWWGDLSDESSRGGFTIDLNNGTATENLNTAVDGVVTIGSGSNGGVRFMKSAASGYQLSVVSRINSGGSVSFAGSPVLFSLRNSGHANRLGVGFSTDGKLYGLWNGAGTNKTRQSSEDPALSDSWIYAAGRFWSMPSSDTTNTHGTYGYWDGDEKVFSNACRNDGSAVYGVTIGGLYDSDTTRHLNGAKFDYVVIFDDATGDVVTDINNFYVSGMTTVGTDLSAATTATGVNLPASATLTAAATPAAVFVQQTSTLTMTGSASLTVNSGTGPLYVADGTRLTIDATGIDVTGVSAGDTVNLVSGKIYGTDLITVKAPVKSGLTITSAITDTGITLTAEACTVSFTSPFDGTTLAAPTTGTGYYTSATSVSFGNESAYQQTVVDRTAVVADVNGGTYTDINGLVKQAQTVANTDMDVYLNISGATATRVNGMGEVHWSLTANQFTTGMSGNAIVQVVNGATVGYVYGAGFKGGYSGSAIATVTGNTGVTVKGGTVNGSVVGGWESAHNKNATVTGNTAVRVEAMLATPSAAAQDNVPNNYIIGGSVYAANNASASTVGGNSSVTIALPNEASGTFDRSIVGGSLYPDAVGSSGAQSVTGSSSVTITANNNVTFSGNIVGGGCALRQNANCSTPVGQNASVTISGGVYTGRIVAGGYAPSTSTASVGGTATLTLNSGTFTGATLDGGNATGAKTLVVGDNLDISGATVTGFTAVTLGDGATAQMETGEEGTATLGSGAVLKLIIDDADIADGYTPSVSGAGTVEYYEYVESVLTQITDAARLDGNNLRASAPIWSPASADASGNLADTARWSTGALPENDASIVKFVVNGNNTLTVNETRTFGHVYVEGSGTLLLEGDGTHHLTVGYLDVASGTTVTINDADNPLYVTDGTIDGSGTLTLANGANLTLDGVTKTSSISLTIPSGTTLTIGGDGTTTLPFGDRGIGGNIIIEEDATLISTTSDAPDYNSACNIYIYGTLTLNSRWSMNANNKIYCYTGATINGTGDSAAALDLLNQNTTIYVNPHPDTQATGTVTCSAKIRLRGNATVNVAEGMTFLMTGNTIKQNDNCGYTKTGSGILHIKGAFTPGGTTTVSAGKILFEDTNIGSADLPGILAGSGTVEFKSTSTHNYFYASASGFTGKIIVTKAGSTWPHIIGTAPQTSSETPPELEVSGGVVLTHTLNNASFYVKDLSGSGTIDTGYGTIANDDHTPRTIDVLLTKNSAFGGVFSYSDTSYKHRNACLTVRGADDAESVYALTLSGVSTSYGPLVVENNAKVVFTSTGSWRNGQVTVGANGCLQSDSSAETLAAELVCETGATLKFGSQPFNVGALTINGATTIDLSGATLSSDGTTIISCGSITAETDISNLTPNAGYLTATAGAIKAYPIAASVIMPNVSDITYYSSLADVVANAPANATILLLGNTTAGLSLKAGQVFNTQGYTCGTVTAADGAVVGVSGNYYTGYSNDTAATWTGAADANWNTASNWNYGFVPVATTPVVFSSDASVTLDVSPTVAGIAVGGDVSITASAKSLNTSGNVTGTGSLTLSDVCLASAAAGITVAPNVNFTNDSELAGANVLTLNGAVVISDTFKVWDSNHVINGNVTINSGVTFRYGALLLINGAATVKGAFTRDAGSSSCIKFCGVVTIENGNVSIDGWQSGNLDDAATVVLAGATATLTDSRGIQIALEKVTTSLYNRYVNKAGNIYSVVKPGTIFSVY